MALKYHREDDVDISSIFPSRALNLEHAGCEDGIGEGTAGRAQTQHGYGSKPGARAC